MSIAADWRDGTNPARLAMMLDAAGWGIVLGRPGNTFALGHNYNLLALWASEDTWAVLFLIAAAVLILATISASRGLRIAAAVYACVLQAAVAVSFGAAPVMPTGFMTHVGIALLGSWLVWRELAP